MAKEQQQLVGSPKYHQPENGSRRKGYSRVLVTGLCCLTFYCIGVWQNSSKVHIDSTTVSLSGCSSGPLDFGADHTDAYEVPDTERELAACDMSLSEYTPCEDAKRSLRFPRERLIYRERHCPSGDEKLSCLVPAPPGYRNPFPWPKSREYAWFANVPHKELTVEKAIQNWIQYEGDRFYFPGGGTMFPRGADAYIQEIASVIPLNDGSLRTALDTGCGVASWGGYLLKRNILAMSFAPRDTHEGQVQFALERGIPATIGIMASQRLPYPARSFDMAHCSRCLIPWSSYDGLYLTEVDRVLRPGGFWILSGPPVNWKVHWKSWQRTKEDLNDEMTSIEETATSLCWRKVSERGNIAIWQKPFKHDDDCVTRLETSSKLKLCDASQDPDKAWYTPMEACVTPMPEATTELKLNKWPARLTSVPPRVAAKTISDITAESFTQETNLWSARVARYRESVVPLLAKSRYRNIMDMNAGLGGFAAALAKTDNKVWVMNVVPHQQKDTLGVVYERGLIGVYHDWCEAFSTYPRTYDLLHANNVFSLYQDRCDLMDILIEMDRILRPEGAVVIRDEVDLLNKVRRAMNRIRWQSKLVDHEDGPFNREKILVAVKSYWVGNSTSSN